MKLKDIAVALDGALVGDGEAIVARPAHPADAAPGDLALAVEPKALALLAATRARVAVVAAGAVPPGSLAGYIAVKRPRYALAALTRLFDRPVLPPPGVHATAVVEAGAELGDQVAVGALAWIGPGARIGARTVIMPQASVGAGAVVGADCVIHNGARIGAAVAIGARVTIHPNAVIGADGFSYATPEPGSVETARAGSTATVTGTNAAIAKIHSLGTVIIGDDVEIGACATIDRATIAATRVGRGTKIDNLAMVAHNATIGENCLIAGETGVAGSAVIGDRVVIAAQAGIADHATVGADAIIAAATAVGHNVAPREIVMGVPALPRGQFLEQMLNVARLKLLRATVADLKQRVALIEAASQKERTTSAP